MLRLLAASTLGLIVGAGSSSADPPSLQGWWTTTNPGASPAGLPTVTPPRPPDVPDNGLLIESGPQAGKPFAFAALVYELPAQASATSLTLDIAPGSATTPGSDLTLCPLDSAIFVPSHGGPISDAPRYDCRRSVSTSPDADGSKYIFNLTGVTKAGDLAVAVLAGSPSSRIVLLPPDRSSLGGASSRATQDTPPAADDESTAMPASQSLDTGVIAVPQESDPTAGAPTAAVAEQHSDSIPMNASASAAPSHAGHGFDPRAGALGAAGLVSLVVLWGLAGRAPRPITARSSSEE